MCIFENTIYLIRSEQFQILKRLFSQNILLPLIKNSVSILLGCLILDFLSNGKDTPRGSFSYFRVLLCNVVGWRLWADSMFSAGALFKAGCVERANGFAVGIQVKVKQEVEVNVEPHVGLVVLDGFPLPVRYSVQHAGVLFSES